MWIDFPFFVRFFINISRLGRVVASPAESYPIPVDIGFPDYFIDNVRSLADATSAYKST